MTTEEVVQAITDYVNSYSSKEKEFCEAMSREHRTLQQSFTKLCFQWLEHVSSPDYRTDGRNEQSKRVSKQLLDSFTEMKRKEGYSGSTLELVSKPSLNLSLI